jgi:hypothetical protein
MFFGFVVLAIAFLICFVVIARKGRKLRTTYVLPDEASHATFESSDGKQYKVETKSHFYFGKHPGCQIVLGSVQDEYAVCVFYHRRRFAFETLSSSRGIQVNGEEQMAGYLKNGDVLEIGGETFTFRCF